MDFGLKGKTAVVTASSSGLGRAIGLELATEGANLVINSRGEEALLEAAKQIETKTGCQVLPVAADVTDESQILRLIDRTLERFGKLDILVANAGGPPAGQFVDFQADHYRNALELNLISTVNLVRAAIPHMLENKWGRVIAITSIAAKQPVDNLILSNTARAGVLGFMKSVSQQVAADGVTVNTVCPGYHLTERLEALGRSIAQKEGISREEIYARWSESVPMKRIGEPREFAAVVAFLCSERASYVNGTVIQVDGGAYRGLV
jgi:3-oxoacyl-[acyl-carrier protein] reductase